MIKLKGKRYETEKLNRLITNCLKPILSAYILINLKYTYLKF